MRTARVHSACASAGSQVLQATRYKSRRPQRRSQPLLTNCGRWAARRNLVGQTPAFQETCAPQCARQCCVFLMPLRWKTIGCTWHTRGSVAAGQDAATAATPAAAGTDLVATAPRKNSEWLACLMLNTARSLWTSRQSSRKAPISFLASTPYAFSHRSPGNGTKQQYLCFTYWQERSHNHHLRLKIEK